MAQSRQRIWDYLRRAKNAKSIHEIADRTNTDIETVQRYLSALKKAGYVTNADQKWSLQKNTGKIALKVNSRGESTDHNLNPPMHAGELSAIIKHSGFSYSAFSRIVLGTGGLATRLRKQAEGIEPVGQTIAAKARDWKTSMKIHSRDKEQRELKEDLQSEEDEI